MLKISTFGNSLDLRTMDTENIMRKSKLFSIIYFLIQRLPIAAMDVFYLSKDAATDQNLYFYLRNKGKMILSSKSFLLLLSTFSFPYLSSCLTQDYDLNN